MTIETLGLQKSAVILRLASASSSLVAGALVYLMRAVGFEFQGIGQVPSFLHAAGFVILLSLFDVKTNAFLISAILVFLLSAFLEWVQINGSIFYSGTFDYFDLVATLAGATLGVVVLYVTLGRAGFHHA